MKTIKTFLLAGMTAILLTTPTSCTDYQDEIDALDVRVTYLESLVDIVNSDLASLKTIADALKNADYITNITQNAAGDWVINFYKHGPIVIHNGKDATMPNIAVEQDPTDGNYYWKLNGDWLTGPDGQRVKANGKDGKDGANGENGKDGKDGISPQVRIVDGQWEVSTDGGATWIKTGTLVQGKDGENGKNANTIVDVRTYWTEDGGYVEFITDSGSFRVPLQS
jgi:hypothetical protein